MTYSIYSSFKQCFHKETGHCTSEEDIFCVIFKVRGPSYAPDSWSHESDAHSRPQAAVLLNVKIFKFLPNFKVRLAIVDSI